MPLTTIEATTMDGGQRTNQTAWAMARGSSADADAGGLRGGLGPRGLLVGGVVVVVMAAAVAFVFLRGDVTYAAATAVEVDLATGQVMVDYEPPDDGCWAVADASSVAVEGSTVVLDLEVAPTDQGCPTSHVLRLDRDVEFEELPATMPVAQVACDSGAVECGDPIDATVVQPAG